MAPMAFLAKLKRLMSKTSEEANDEGCVLAHRERRNHVSLITLATVAHGDDAEAFFPRLFLQAVRPRRIIVERPISHGVFLSWFLMMVSKGSLDIPEVNRILGIQGTLSKCIETTQLCDTESNAPEPSISDNSACTIVVSPTLTPMSFSGPSTPQIPASTIPSIQGLPVPEKLYLQDFALQGVVGSGNFGTVKLARYKRSGKLFALKVVSKNPLPRSDVKVSTSQTGAESGKTLGNTSNITSKLDEGDRNSSVTELSESGMKVPANDATTQQWASAVEEYFSMRRMEGSPWAAQLLGSFHDQNNFYFVMPFYPGGDLQSLLDNNSGRLPYEQARLYTGHLILGVEALREHGIVHRDLKPGNILIDETGHLVIADFGLSRCFETHMSSYEKSICGLPIEGDDDDECYGINTTRCACGTPDYAAPELYLEEAYSYPVDIWAIGVIAFRMFVGRSPWGEWDSMKALAVKIVRGRFHIEKWERHSYDLPLEVELFLREALDKHQVSRPIATDLKSNALFDHFEWERLSRRTLPTPCVPSPFETNPTEDSSLGTIPAVSGNVQDSSDDFLSFFNYVSPALSAPSLRTHSQKATHLETSKSQCLTASTPLLNSTTLSVISCDTPTKTLAGSADMSIFKSRDSPQVTVTVYVDMSGKALPSAVSIQDRIPTGLARIKKWMTDIWRPSNAITHTES